MLVSAIGCGHPSSDPVPRQPLQQLPPADTVAETPPSQPPVDATSLQEETVAALEAGDDALALQVIRRAKRAAPDNPDVIYLMARVLAERNRFAEAVKMLDDLAKLAPETRLPSLGQAADWLVRRSRALPTTGLPAASCKHTREIIARR